MALLGPRAARALREIGIWSSLALVVAGGAGFAWLSRHPDAPIVAAAAQWPVVGVAARRFQARWLPPPGSVAVDPASPADPSVTRVWVPVRDVVVEDFFDLPPSFGRRSEERRPDTAPAAGAITGPEAVGAVSLPADWTPWEAAGAPPLGELPMLPLPRPGRQADPERLALARSFFDGPVRESRLGPYPLLTDVEDPALLEPLATAAEQAEPLYVSRYGASPRGRAEETIVLYRSEAAYRRLQDRSGRIRGMVESRGHVGWGLVALYADDPDEAAIAEVVLRHELAHLLNRRALGPALPPWLDEGIADDLAAHVLDGLLAPREAPLESMRTVIGDRVEMRGSLAALAALVRAQGDGSWPAVPVLLELEWEEFVRAPRGLHYAASTWLVRYLLDEESGHRFAFRAFLRRVARGGGVAAADLETELGLPLAEIELGFRRYVARRASAAGLGGAVLLTSSSSSRQLDSPSR